MEGGVVEFVCPFGGFGLLLLGFLGRGFGVFFVAVVVFVVVDFCGNTFFWKYVFLLSVLDDIS